MGLPPRAYVLLHPAGVAGGVPRHEIFSTLRALRAAVGGDLSRGTLVYHAFPSVSECHAYVWAVGRDQP